MTVNSLHKMMFLMSIQPTSFQHFRDLLQHWCHPNISPLAKSEIVWGPWPRYESHHNSSVRAPSCPICCGIQFVRMLPRVCGSKGGCVEQRRRSLKGFVVNFGKKCWCFKDIISAIEFMENPLKPHKGDRPLGEVTPRG